MPLKLVPPAPKLVYQWERFGLIAKELPVLIRQHWEEVETNRDTVPLDPHWDRYFEYDLLDILNVLTVRANGVLVGYLFVLVFPHLHHHSTMWAQTDLFWLNPAYREGWAGVRMFREMETHIKGRGAKVVKVVVKLFFEAERGTLGKLLKRLGYVNDETVWSKFIG